MAIITGTNDGETLTGTSDSDTIDGLAGNDQIDGAGGADIMRGGLGDDIFFVDASGDQVVELSGEGTDEVRTAISFTLGSFVETLTLMGGAAIDGGGNSLNNRINGNSAANRIIGNGGSDTFAGGGGDDYYVVQAEVFVDGQGGYAFSGVDQIVELAGDGIDTVETNVGGSLGDNVENMIVVGDLDLAMFGNALDNVLIGNNGRNLMQAGEGDDLLDGGLGADNMNGGAGDDTYVVDNDGDLISEAPDGGIDTVRAYGNHTLGFSLENLILLGSGAMGTGNQRDNRITGTDNVNTLSGEGGDDVIEGRGGDDGLFGGFGADTLIGGDGRDYMRGGAGNDLIDGGADNDTFYVDDGGTDSAFGGGGNDGFYFGWQLDAADVVDGGAGADTLAIRGLIPPGFVFGAGNLIDIEVLLVSSGKSWMFPGPGGGDVVFGSYSYDLTTVDANVGAGRILTVIAGAPSAQEKGLQADESLQFDGSAEADGAFRIFAGLGVDVLTGGAGNDGFFFETGGLTGSDIIDGGAGIDSVALRGFYQDTEFLPGDDLVLGGTTLVNVEVLVLLTGLTNQFGGALEPGGFDYDLTLGDGNVAAGATLTVNGAGLAGNEILLFDGSAETDGRFIILAGAGEDILTGGSQGDQLYGGLGADDLNGGLGADTYTYRATAESTASDRDDLALGDGDRIDLSFIDAVAGSSANDGFTFVGAAAFSGAAGELRAVQSGGQWIVEGDVNGDGNADLVISVASADPILASDFVL